MTRIDQVGDAALLVIGLRVWLKYDGSFPGDRWAATHLDLVGLAEPYRDLGTFFSVICGAPVAIATGLSMLWFVWRAMTKS